jgi:hypothetical protein
MEREKANEERGKHTPGPWRLTEAWVRRLRGKRFWEPVVIETGQGDIVIDQGPGRGQSTQIANATLITAAPDMLEALEKLSTWMDELRRFGGPDMPKELLESGLPHNVGIAEAAIAKATGQA